ncbi:hypothetical protein JM946_18875 [Steroidobacter sp. S1-65]|uniref:Uncharacterized protein n=1 Tax=Steroidobacter gossypii TaxID=2805490 RepID=A0ABS1X0R3_9GAMM|nr:hypothetical protein [Steroidobacter gossypii]MBM0106802.1 hypothetical protein [Steroidobacter gossypii]
MESRESCSVQDSLGQERGAGWLGADDELIFPKHKRVFAQYVTGEGGVTELRLYYGDKEISFDEPELFEFGEGLAKQPRFIAGTATTWGPNYEWPRIRELLEQLVDEGVLQRATAEAEPELPASREPSRPSPLPPAPCAVPRTWLEAEALIPELTGRPLELGYLELVLPLYRIPHVAMDAEGRQVGEGNVFPKALRVEVPTEWRACPHAGSRYQHERPMNVSALKSMRAHWKQMMVALLRVREVYLQKFPRARQQWTVGDLHCLSALVLSIPGYLMLRAQDRVENGQLHPVLSSMYRVTDGVRMVMHHMLFSEDLEPTLPLHAPMTSAELYAYAERNDIFISDHGVCAGPRAMIEEFLRVIMDGQEIEDAASVELAPEVEAALNDLDQVFEYVLHGLQAYSVVFSRWPAMTRSYEQLVPIVAEWADDRARPFQERMERSLTFLRMLTRQNTEERRLKREQVYVEMYARSANALHTTEVDESLKERIAPIAVGNDAAAGASLHTLLKRRFDGIRGADDAAIARMTAVLMDYFRREQAIVRASAEIQQNINQLLGRQPPSRPLTGTDLAIHYRLLEAVYTAEHLATVGGHLPYLTDDLEEQLQLRIVVTGDAIDISPRIHA